MKPNRRLAALAAAMMAATAVPLARAADKLPPQGTASYVTYYTNRPLTNIDMGDTGSQALLEFVGVTRNTGGVAKAFDNMAVRCIGYREAVGGKVRVFGSCIETDNDGDRVFTTFEGSTHIIVGGTGKYKGISGSAPFTVTPAPSPGTGLNALVVDHRVSWHF